MRRCGCGPAVRFRSCPQLGAMGAAVVLTGIGLPDDGLHSPNEKLDLQQLWDGIGIFASFMEKLANESVSSEM